LRVLFLGSPPFATPVLAALLESRFRPIAVVTPPNRPRGRGRRVEPSPVASLADEAGVLLIQPISAKDLDFQSQVRELKPDVMMVVSYGEILNQDFLDLAPALNIHGSLLPRHRGASPIQTAILQGDQETGVTIQRIVLALDAGDILHEKRTNIGAGETSGELFGRLENLGVEAALEALEMVDSGRANFAPQDESQATHCHKIKKPMGIVDWSRPSAELDCHVRGMNPWPSAQTSIEDGRGLKIHKARVLAGDDLVQAMASEVAYRGPGTVIEADKRFLVITGDGVLELQEVQLAGKRSMGAADLLRGLSLAVGSALGSGV
jgi:methionyl-tRNA formyltransferase